MKVIYQHFDIESPDGTITIYKRCRNMGYQVVTTPDDNRLAPKITNAQALALANAIYDDLGLGWKPYPANKPTYQKDKYCVHFLVQRESYLEPWRARYHPKNDAWVDQNGDQLHDVTAFRTLSEPYQPYEGLLISEAERS